MSGTNKGRSHRKRDTIANKKAAADRFAREVYPLIQKLRKEEGVTTLTGIADTLNNRGIATASGGKWYSSTVKNILDRIENGS